MHRGADAKAAEWARIGTESTTQSTVPEKTVVQPAHHPLQTSEEGRIRAI